MRQINVSTDVFALIWQARLPDEHNETDILLRILKSTISDSPFIPTSGRSASSEEGPLGNVKSVQDGEKLPGVPANIRNGYWWQVIKFALERLGRPADLAEIYREVIAICRACDRHMPLEIEATVRGTLEDNSLDSHRYKGVRDIFCMPEGKYSGVWALRSAPA